MVGWNKWSLTPGLLGGNADKLFELSNRLKLTDPQIPGMTNGNGIGNRPTDVDYGILLPHRWGSELVGRSIFSVSLDQIPMSGNLYKSGVDTRFTKPILLELTQDNEIENIVDSVYVQYVFIEFDYTIKIGFNGFITKEF